MTELSIICFNGVSICLALWNFISTQVILKPMTSVKPITVVLFRFRRLVNDTLDCFLGAYPDYCPAQNTSGFAVYNSQNVDSVFLSPMNVKISSISASLTSSGTGAFDKASARSVSHDETVCGETFRWRAIRRKLPPLTYISAARFRRLSGYPWCFGIGVYLPWQCMHRYLCEPASVLPALFWRVVAWHFGHFCITLF